MSSVVVVDASALAAVAFQEPEWGAVRTALEGRALVVPRLLAYELTNVAAMKLRRHPANAALIRAGLEGVLADDFAIYWSDVDHMAVLALAEKTGLKSYDASYLWLAMHLEADLVTLDADLQRAYQRLQRP